MTTTRDDRRRLFAGLTRPSTVAEFVDRVADDVDRVVEGTDERPRPGLGAGIPTARTATGHVVRS